jgi:hypothetical protein
MAETFPTRAARLLGRSWARPKALLLNGEGLWDPAHGGQAYRDFEAWCAAHPGQPCELWIGASALAEVGGDDDAGAETLRSPAARADWVRRVLHHYHGEAATQWPLLPWQAAGAWGASALRGVTLADLKLAGKAHGVVLRAVRPLWPRLIAQLLAQQAQLRRSGVGQAWLVEAVRAGGGPAHLTRVGLTRGRISSVQRRRLELPWGPALQRLLEEEPPAAGAMPALLWLGSAPDGKLPLQPAITLLPPYREALPQGAGGGPDFLQPQPRPGMVAWAWLGTCAAVLALAAGDAREAWAHRAQVQAVAVPAAPPRTVATRAGAADPAEQALRQRLQHPWREVFLASEVPATAGLRWLSLEHRAGTELRLQGEAGDSGPVQRAAAALRQRPAWQQVLVARLEAQPPRPGANPGSGPGPGLGVSFEIAARLREVGP